MTLINGDNYFESTTNPETASLAVYLMAVNHLGNILYGKGQEVLADNFFETERSVHDILYNVGHADLSQNTEEAEIDRSVVSRFLD